MSYEQISNDELDQLIESAELSRNDRAADQILVEIISRLGRGQRPTVKALIALARALASVVEAGKSGSFLFPGGLYKRGPGRPIGSKTKLSEAQALNRLSAVLRIIPQEKSPISDRQARRIRAQITGERRKPGRPKKSDT